MKRYILINRAPDTNGATLGWHGKVEVGREVRDFSTTDPDAKPETIFVSGVQGAELEEARGFVSREIQAQLPKVSLWWLQWPK